MLPSNHPIASHNNQPQPQFYPPPPQPQMEPTVVVGQPTAHNVTIIQPREPVRPSNYLVLAIITCICFNILFGIIAIILSGMSSSSADEGDMEQARAKGKTSLAMSLIGVLFSLTIVIIVIIMYFVVWVNNATKETCRYPYCN